MTLEIKRLKDKILLGFLLLLSFMCPNETLGQEDFTAYTNQKLPIITDNPASIALLRSKWSYQFDYPIIYSIPSSSNQAIYNRDVHTATAEQNYKTENTTHLGIKLGTRKFGLTYKTSSSLFKNKERESCTNYEDSNATCTYNVDSIGLGTHFDEEKIQSQNLGLLFGFKIGNLSLGIKYDLFTRESSIKAHLNELSGSAYRSHHFKNTYNSNYGITTYGALFNSKYFTLSYTYQPSVLTHYTVKRDYVKFGSHNNLGEKIKFNIPIKTISGIELKQKFHNKFKTKFLYDIGEIKDVYDELNEEYNLYGVKVKKPGITGRLLELIFKKHIILFGNRSYNIGEASVKKTFFKYMFEIGSWKWKFGLNEISIITPENIRKFPYPTISLQIGDLGTRGKRGARLPCNLCPTAGKRR